MEGTGANLRLPLNPPFFFESVGAVRRDDRRRNPGDRFRGAEFRAIVPSGQVRAWDPNLRPQFTQQWNVFAEYLVTSSMSANVGYVGHKATTWSRRSRVTSRCRASAIRPPGRRSDTRRPLFATAPSHHQHRDDRIARGRSDYNALQVSLRQRNVKGLEYLASYTLGRVRSNNLGYYGSAGVAAEGAYWMNTYEPEWNYGPAFFDARHNLVFSANYELPYGRGRTWGIGRLARRGCHSRRLEAERHLPGANRLPHHRDRRRAIARCKASAATSGRTASAIRCRPTRPSPAGWTSTPSRAFRLAPGATVRIGVARAPGYKNIDLVLAKRFSAGGERAFEFRAEAFNLTNTPSFGPPAARHQRAEHVRPDHEHGQHRADS